MESATRRDLKLIVDNEDFAEGLSQADRPASKEEMHRWPICGLPVASFLQVIAMDQQTCILEVYQSADRQGRVCFVQGSFMTLSATACEGEDAALEMVSWESVRLNIRQIVDAGGFAKKIDKSLMSILMESSSAANEAADAHGGTEKEKTARRTLAAGGRIQEMPPHSSEDMGDALISASVADLSTGNVLGVTSQPKNAGNRPAFHEADGFPPEGLRKRSRKKRSAAITS